MAGSGSRLGFTLSPHKVSLSVLIQDLCTPERVPMTTRPVLSVFLLEQARQAGDFEEKSLSQLCDALSSLQLPLGASLEQQLVRTLRRIESPDDLFDTLINLEALLQDGSAVEDEMPGLDSSSVLGIFVRKVLLAFHRTMFDGLSQLYTRLEAYVAEADGMPLSPASRVPQAHSELANFIQHHADVMESMPPSLQMEGSLDAVLKSMGEPAGGSYLRFLYAVQQQDYESSIEHMHRYFDYAMVGRGIAGSGRERGVLQWAVLQLASLHFRLGHMPLSLIALEEAVRLAQHASDHHCLASALVWLMRLVGVAGERELEGQLLRRALLRAAQLRHAPLQEQALLSLALHRVNYPLSKRPPGLASAQDQRGMQVVWKALGARGGGGAAALLEGCIRGGMGHTLLSGGAVAAMHEDASADHMARSVCLKAIEDSQKMGPSIPMARLLKGRAAFPKHLISKWHHASLLLMQQRALARGEYNRAQVLVGQMAGMHVPSAQVSPLLEAEQAHAELLTRTGDPVHAIALLRRLKDLCEARRVGIESIPVSVSLASSLSAVGAWGSALSASLKVIAVAEDAGMESCRVAGMLVLSDLELSAGRPGHALSLLLRIQRIANTSSSLPLRAQSSLLLARCLLSGAPSPYPCPAMEAAASHLDKAVSMMSTLGCAEGLREASHLRALTAHAMGDVPTRDRAAAIFVESSAKVCVGIGAANQLCVAPLLRVTALANEP